MPWTTEEQRIGERFLEAFRTFSGTFEEKRNQTASSIGYRGYMEMPQGTRQYISHIGQETKKRKAEERKKEQIKQMTEDWWEHYNSNTDFRHGMTHPDDE